MLRVEGMSPALLRFFWLHHLARCLLLLLLLLLQTREDGGKAVEATEPAAQLHLQV